MRKEFREICPHGCGSMMSLQVTDGRFGKCHNCQKYFQFLLCPGCIRVIFFPRCNYKPLTEYVCPFSDCRTKYQQFPCAHCNRSIHFKGAKYVHGRVVSCPFKDCKKKFQTYFCPHCKHRNVNKKSNYSEGSVVECQNNRCGRTFKQVSCPKCKRCVNFPNCEYTEGEIMQCPYSGCRNKFRQGFCPHCVRSVIWTKRKAPNKVYTCPYPNCRKSFQHVNCEYCRQAKYFKKPQKSMRNLKCDNEECLRIFTPSIGNFTPGSRPNSPFYPLSRPASPFVPNAQNRPPTGPNRSDQSGPSPDVIKIVEARIPWADPVFPPDERSLSPDLHNPPIKWLRLHDLFPEANLRLFPTEKIDLTSVRITPINSKEHAMVSAFLSLYQNYPQVLRKIFLTQEVNRSGIYELHLCVSGRWKRIVIDDCVPVRYFKNNTSSGNETPKNEEEEHNSKDQFQIAFTGLLGNGVFLILLEKAFAKIHGGYGNYAKYCDGPFGLPLAWETFTGLPTENFHVGSIRCRDLIAKNVFFPKLCEYFKNGHILGLVTKPEKNFSSASTSPKSPPRSPPNDEKNNTGRPLSLRAPVKVSLPYDHPFIICDMSEVDYRICLRNPSPTLPIISSSSTEEEEEQQLDLLKETKGGNGGEKKGENCFWVSWESVLHQASTVQVCFLRKAWVEKRVRVCASELIEFDIQSGNGAPCVGFVGGIHQGRKYEGDGLDELLVPPNEKPLLRNRKIRNRANSGDSTRQGNYKPIGFIVLNNREVVIYQGMRICSSNFSHDVHSRDISYLRNGKYRVIPIISGLHDGDDEDLVFHFSFHTNARNLSLKKRVTSTGSTKKLISRLPFLISQSELIKTEDEVNIEKGGNFFKMSRYWMNDEIIFVLEWSATKPTSIKEEYNLYKFDFEFDLHNLVNVVHCKRSVVLRPKQVIVMGWFVRKDAKVPYSVEMKYMSYYSLQKGNGNGTVTNSINQKS